MRYALLMAVYKTDAGATLCLLQGFLSLLTTNGEQLLNEFECPLLELTKMLFTTPGGNILKAVNIGVLCLESLILNTYLSVYLINYVMKFYIFPGGK